MGEIDGERSEVRFAPLYLCPFRAAWQDPARRYRKRNVRQQQAVAEIITALAAKDRRR